jgi:peptidoglycan/LPS O-acetylase OafA/YrhL
LHKHAQIPIINNLRGVAALAVCLYHFIYTTTNYVKDQSILNVTYYGQFGVALFFVISGVVIPLSLIRANYKIKNWPKFFIKRVVRIEPPYIVALLLAIIIAIARKRILNETTVELSFTQITLHLGYLIPFFEGFKWLNNVFWTLAIEFQYYLVISVLILLVTEGKIAGRFVFYILMMLSPFYFTNPNFFPSYSALFLMGICWSFYYLKKSNLLEFLVVLFLSFLIVYLKLGHIEAIVGIITTLIIQVFTTSSIKILDFFGNISYSLYLIHPLIGGTLINILSHTFVISWQKPIVIMVGIGITVFSSYIMYRIIEKPTQLLSKRITY